MSPGSQATARINVDCSDTEVTFQSHTQVDFTFFKGTFSVGSLPRKTGLLKLQHILLKTPRKPSSEFLEIQNPRVRNGDLYFYKTQICSHY